MNFKKLLVSFVMLVSTLLLVSTVSAAAMADGVTVKVNGINVDENVSVIAGELITVQVKFIADLGGELDEDGNPLSASDVRIKVELEGEKSDVEGTTKSFDVIDGQTYKETMVLRVPYDLQDDLSEDLVLNLKIWNGDLEAYTNVGFPITLKVQRPSYSVDFKSINTDKPIVAGETFPVDVVVKNTGYNKLDDVYVTVSIPELDIEKTVYAGDLFQFDGEDDDENTASVRVMIKVPYDAAEGVYNLEVEARNDDMTMNSVKEIFVKNDFSSIIIVNGNDLLLLNPTGSLMALNLEVDGDATLSENVVVIPAGSSRTVTVSATGSEEYTVNAYTMNGNLVESITMSASETAKGNSVVTILTASLLVIFLVLLAVLVVLVTKKPEKDEELSESYY